MMSIRIEKCDVNFGSLCMLNFGIYSDLVLYIIWLMIFLFCCVFYKVIFWYYFFSKYICDRVLLIMLR